MELRKRVEYIDGLRGLSVVAMFFVHTAVAWLSPSVRGSRYWAWSMEISGLVAPTFLFLAGLSLAIFAERADSVGVDRELSRRRVFRRGAQILALGYGLHFTFFALSGFHGDFSRVFKVDVLHCVGLSMMFFSRFAWPSAGVNSRAAGAFLVLPVFAWLAYRLPLDRWLPPGLSAYLTTREPLALFPFIPYATWVAMGLVVAPWWLAASGSRREELRFALRLAAAGGLLLVAGEALGRLYYGCSLDTLGLDPAIEPRQTKGLVHLFWTKGAIVCFLFSFAAITGPSWSSRAARPLLRFGRRSLLAYSAHLIVIYPVAGPYLSERLAPWQQSLMTVLLTLLMYGLVALRGRFEITPLRRPSGVSRSIR